MARFLLRAISGAAAALAWRAGASAAVPEGPTKAAFVAAYGQGAPVMRNVMRPTNPPGCDCSGMAAKRVSLTVTPQSLVDLGSGRYALVALEKDATASHVEPGAIGIAYLQRSAGGWRLERRWDELAWSGDYGDPADGTRTLDRKPLASLLFAVHSLTYQGQSVVTAWTFALDADAPRLVGHLPISGSGYDDGCELSVCGAYAYQGAIGPSRSDRAIFSVTYHGWREAPGALRKTRFVASTGFRVVGGRLLPDHWVALPDCGGACANGPGYPADESASR